MNRLVKGRILGYLLTLFLAGGVSGWFLSLRWQERQHSGRPDIDKICEHVRNKYRTRLDLTPEQMEKVGALLDQKFREVAAVHAEATMRIDQIHKQTTAEIAKVLRPEQIAVLEEMQRERQQFRKGRPPLPPPPPELPAHK